VDLRSAANAKVDVSGISHPLGKIKSRCGDKRFSGPAKTARPENAAGSYAHAPPAWLFALCWLDLRKIAADNSLCQAVK
jgi:hypothetical protein